MAYSNQAIPTRNGDILALIATPAQNRVMGYERLEELRDNLVASSIDSELVDRVKASKARLVIFRGRNRDNSARFGFDSRLSENECEELGYLLVKSQMEAHRAFLELNLLAIVHAEFGGRELDGFRSGTAQLVQELSSMVKSANVDPALQLRCQIDQWILRNMSFYFAVSYEKVVHAILPDKVPMFELRSQRTRELIKKLEALQSS